MIARLAAGLAALCMAGVAVAQTAPLPSASSTPVVMAQPDPSPPLVKVALDTSDGRIVVALEPLRAPITTANFLRYVDQKRLDGTVFYRAVKVAEDFGFVQFGVQNAPKRVLPPIRHEPSTLTGVKHTDGAISIARFAPGTAQGDFTINLGDAPSLDADPTQPGDNLGYAAFGHVVEGRDVVKKIMDEPTAPGGPFPGQKIAHPVTIVTARRAT